MDVVVWKWMFGLVRRWFDRHVDAVEVLQDMMLEDEVWGRGFLGTRTGLGWDGGEEIGLVGGHMVLGWDGGEEVGLVGGHTGLGWDGGEEVGLVVCHTAFVLDDGGEVVLEGRG